MNLGNISSTSGWANFRDDINAQSQLLALLPSKIHEMRWFGGKGREITLLAIDHLLPVAFKEQSFYFLILEVNYSDFEPEYYLLPLAVGTEPKFPIAEWHQDGIILFLNDATHSKIFQEYLIENILAENRVEAGGGEFVFERGTVLAAGEHYQESYNPQLDQSNSSIFYNGKYFMKIYRKLWRETNPEVEMLKFLTEQGNYQHVPPYIGSLIWERKGLPPITLALMMGKVDAEKDSWASTGDELNDFLQSFLMGDFSIHEFVFEHVELLARRTAEMHLALASPTAQREFAAEPYNDLYREWLLKHIEQLIAIRLKMIEQNKHRLDEEDLKMVSFFKEKQSLILKFFRQIKKKKLHSQRIRIHGDYHLGQLLYTGKDYVVIDFEGEPESSITDRKIKHTPLKDVAGMIRSFHYAVSAKLYYSSETKGTNIQRLQRSSDRWFYLIRDTFLEAYTDRIGKDNPLFYSKSEVNYLLLFHLLEKAIYELGYELNSRPDWVKIPLKGIVQVIYELEKYQE